jgi:hypothetical protein
LTLQVGPFVENNPVNRNLGALLRRPGGNDFVGFGVEGQRTFAALFVVEEDQGRLIV